MNFNIAFCLLGHNTLHWVKSKKIKYRKEKRLLIYCLKKAHDIQTLSFIQQLQTQETRSSLYHLCLCRLDYLNRILNSEYDDEIDWPYDQTSHKSLINIAEKLYEVSYILPFGKLLPCPILHPAYHT